MGTNTGIGIGIGIPFKNNALGGDKPYFPPELKARMIGVWTNYGKKNTDADRNIIKNKIPNAGGDLEILNAAYKLNSGFGEYKVDFLDWTINSPFINERTSFTFSSFNDTNNDIITVYQRVPAVVQSFKIKAKLRGRVLYRYYVNNGDTISVSYYEVKEGINILPDSVDPTSVNGKVGFVLKGLSSIKVEQIPNFEGALVTDGINDIIASIKTLEEWNIGDKGITIVSMIHQINTNTNNFITTNNIRTSGSVVGRNAISLTDKTGIYGWYKDNIQGSTINVINNILGDKADYTASASSNTNLSSKFSVVGYISNDSIVETSQVAWYWTIIANKVLTTDQINQVIAYFNLDRTLKPDILCDVKKQGITNDNHAEFGDKLIDFSGNGRDIQLNNIAWKGDSGIGKYEVDFLDSSIWNSSNSTITSSKIDCKNAITHIMLLYYSVGSKEYPDIPSFKVIKTGADIDYSYINETGSPKSVKIVDGVNILPASHNTLYSGSGRFCGFGNPGMGNSVTITQIPSHAAGLCLDGINDFGKVTGMPVYKDYTVVTDREIFANIGAISSKNNPGAFVETAGNSVYSFGQATSGLNFISTRSISYLSKYSYCGQSITAGAAEDGTDMWLGTIRDNDSRFFNGAIYSLMSFPYSMSKFLIERQLKKHKLGTLHPNMVEFRPVINSNIDIKKINYWDKDWNILHIGDYVSTGNDIKTNITVPNGYKISKVTSNAFDNITIEKSSTEFIYDVKFYGIKKSPQKINLTIEQDENYVLFNPVINSNYDNYKLTFHLREYEKLINIGDYIPKGTYIRANLYLKNNIDELVTFTFNGVNIDYVKSPVLDTAYNIRQIYNYDSPQEVNITIDEYIRYEDIVQPYPVIFQITDRNTNQRYSWGDKIKVGSSIRLSQGEKPNLLSGLYSIQSYEYEGETYSYNQLTNLNIILTKQSISLSCNKTWLLDDNEPKCILSPRLLRIPNSSYKILGYIPDISGHGNHGVIHNSAYAEGSGVNEDGSYQFDSVDDFVTIPTIVGGKQVLMKVNWQSNIGDAILYDQRFNVYNYEFAIYNSNTDNYSENPHAYSSRNNGKTYIDGILNTYIKSAELQNVTHNITATNELSSGSIPASPIIGSNISHDSAFAQMALYDFMLFDEISTDDKIKELNEYVGVEAKVELPPYYWDTYGKTNLDGDKATIQQRGIAVGDYDLTNYNHAYEGMSGYNGYPVVFGANKTWESLSGAYGYTSDVTNTTIHVTHAEHAGNDLLFSYVKKDGALANIKEIPAFRVTIGGLEGNSKFGYRYLATEDATEETLVYLGNGTHELAKSFAPTEVLLDLTRNVWVGIFITPMVEGEVVFDCDITIEVLPEYENGLAYDGITDYSKNANIPVLTDYTYIYKRTIINIPTNAATLLKGADKTNGGAFIADYGNKWQFNFGQYNTIQGIADGINWQTVNSFNGTSINKGENTDDSGITVAKFSNGYTSMVFYKLILYPKTISLLEINFLKNLMEKDEIIDLNNPIFIKNE